MRSSTYSSLDSLRSLDLAVDAGDGPAQATSARFQPQNYLAVFGTGGRLASRSGRSVYCPVWSASKRALVNFNGPTTTR